ncbi:MAG: radical SAM protein [Polyangiaceae bacterium]|nr:radical SAM protein [Polyangiaceae bacterium]
MGLNRDTVRRRLSIERGALTKEAPHQIALAYPSPYGAGMSSLGYQRIYRLIQELDGFSCERFFLDDDAETNLEMQTRPLSYESLRPFEAFAAIAFSVAYEIEIAGVVRMLDASGIDAERKMRREDDSIVLLGGPLTFSNPLPLAAIGDIIIMGEAEEITPRVLEVLVSPLSKAEKLKAIADIEHVFVPAVHGSDMPRVAAVDNEMLPAWAPIMTPDTVLSDMFLIETERGCSRGCAYCVMRRSTNGGMRIVAKERILGLIPEDAKRVGLVGAAVSDHPKIVEIVNELCDRGIEVGLSSLRPDRLTDAFVGALKRGGYKTLTTAMDGPSERLRDLLNRKARIKHLLQCAELAREHKMDRLKLYLMIGLPGETDEDIDECVAFSTELSKRIPLSLGIAPFCAKRNTPLDGEPFAGIKVVHERLERLKRGVKGRVEIRSTSAKWAWVEYVLAQGGVAEGEAVVRAARAGGGFADYKRSFESLGESGTMKRPKRKLAIATL